MTLRSDWFMKGVYQDNFKDTPTFKKVFDILKNQIYARKLKSGFEFYTKPKYKNMVDIRPHGCYYDDSFLDLVFDHNIPQLLKELTGEDLYLAVIRVRINLKGQAYTGLHRDMHMYGGRVKGNIPPHINLMYYPNFDEEPETQVTVWPGGHIKHTTSAIKDKVTSMVKKGTEIKTDNKQFTIFDTSMLHKVHGTNYEQGALRMMFHFVRKEQLDQNGFDKFADFQQKYIERL